MKDAVLYSEKFINSKFRPSLSNYGGKAIDGFIAVTASGLVCHCSCSVISCLKTKNVLMCHSEQIIQYSRLKIQQYHDA